MYISRWKRTAICRY